MTTAEIRKIILSMPAVPTMPSIVAATLNEFKAKEPNIKTISELVSKDISITTEILKLVNSAYYGLSSHVTSINKAIALLGLNKIKSIIMSVALKPMLQTNGGKRLWEHSIRCAVGCEIISSSLDQMDSDEAFTMGLLHDIGQIIFNMYNKSANNEVNRLVKLGAERLAAEKMMFGCDHTQIGEELMNIWKLPLILQTCVRYHHSPHLSQIPSSVGIVYVAERIVQDPIKYPILDPDIINKIDLDLPDPHTLREEIFRMSNIIITTLSGA